MCSALNIFIIVMKLAITNKFVKKDLKNKSSSKRKYTKYDRRLKLPKFTESWTEINEWYYKNVYFTVINFITSIRTNYTNNIKYEYTYVLDY